MSGSQEASGSRHAQKRARTPSTSSDPPPVSPPPSDSELESDDEPVGTGDVEQFYNDKSKNWFDRRMKSKKITPETDFPSLYTHRLFFGKGLNRFFKREKKYNDSIVREFYANLFGRPDDIKGSSFSRGVNVPFTREVVARHYRLPEFVGECAFATRPVRPADPDDFVRVLCAEGQDWVRHPDGVPRHLVYASLKPDVQLIYKFVANRLLPTTHFTEIIMPRAFLLYYLCTGANLDFAGIIVTNAEAAAKGTVHGALPYPGLITYLCLKRGAKTFNNDARTYKPPVLDSTPHPTAAVAPVHRRRAPAGGASTSAAGPSTSASEPPPPITLSDHQWSYYLARCAVHDKLAYQTWANHYRQAAEPEEPIFPVYTPFVPVPPGQSEEPEGDVEMGGGDDEGGDV